MGATPSIPSTSGHILAATVLRLPMGAAVAAVPVMAVAGLAQTMGRWQPGVALGSVIVGIVIGVVVARQLPAARLPAWAALTVLAIAAGAGIWAALTHGEHLSVRRDSGAYATYALSLAQFGGVPIDPQLDVFGVGATDPFVRVSSGANYQVPIRVDGSTVDLSVVPQFLIGTPATLTLGWWAAGWTGLFVTPAVTGALALCAFAALASLVTGPRTTVLATLVLAITQPVLLVLRQTYSEPLSMLMLVAVAIAAVLAADHRNSRVATWLGILAGGLLGANLFVRIDGLREVVLLIPALTVLALLRHACARGWLVGLAAVGAPAAVAALPWSSPYVRQVSGSVIALLVAGAVASIAGIIVATWGRDLGPRITLRITQAAPWVVAGAVVIAAVVLTSRPLWLVERRESGLPGAREFVSALQTEQGIEIDPTRTYAENSVEWLSWWVGPPALVLAVAAAAVALYRGLQRVRDPESPALPGWFVPLSVGVASALLSLYRPAITPDHPWADRRFVTTTLPTVVLVASIAVAWLATRAGPVGSWRRRAAAAILAAAVVVPAALATWPVATTRTEVGQREATEAVCDALPDRAAVITIDHQSRVEWTPVLRARCDIPTIGLTRPDDASEAAFGEAVAAAAAAARASGYSPMVMAGSALSLPRLPVSWTHVVDLDTTEPQRVLLTRPDGTRPLANDLWLAEL